MSYVFLYTTGIYTKYILTHITLSQMYFGYHKNIHMMSNIYIRYPYDV